MAVNAGQTLNDRILAARHSIAGQGLAKAVCKATTEELIGPKKKHLDYLLHCTEEPNVSIPTLANLLIERTQNQNWIVVFKGLVTLHHMMCYGNERFIQYLASSNTNFQLSNFLDKSGVNGYDMSPFVRRYAKYLSEKSVSYRTVAFDFCKVRRGKEGGTLRQMSADKLIKTLPTLQNQIDSLLDFDVTTNDLNNGVINAAFMLLFRDLIRLFACYNDGIINLLEKYFDMNKKHARDALDLYKKFLIRMDRVADFLKVAEKFGIDKSDIPDLARAPSSLLDALEAHLANLEGRKPGSAATTPTATSGRVNVASAVNILSSTSTSFGGAQQIDEKLQKQLLEEEENAMKQFNKQKGTNPFAAAPEPAGADNGTPNILDLFGVSGPAPGAAAAPPTVTSAPGGADGRASDDLLQLAGNPFASVLNSSSSTTAQPSTGPTPPGAAPAAATSFSSTPFSSATASASNANGLYPNPSTGSTSAAGGFATDTSFSNVFGNQNSTLDATGVGASFFGEILQPQGGVGGGVGGAPATGNGTGPGGKLVSGDLDASLANLTSNLNLGGGQAKTFKADTKGPPMGSRMMGMANNNGNGAATQGFNATNTSMIAVVRPMQSSPLNMYHSSLGGPGMSMEPQLTQQLTQQLTPQLTSPMMNQQFSSPQLFQPQQPVNTMDPFASLL